MARTFLSDFISLFFPRTCEACDGSILKQEEIICSSCLHDLPRTHSHIHKIGGIESKFYGKVKVSNTWSFLYFKKNSPVQKLLHRLKYENKPEIGEFLGKLYGSELKKELESLRFDSIIPVPLHNSRRKRRGYNQSEFFGIGLGTALNLPVDNYSIKRIKKSQTQTNKSRIERWENVAEIFHVEQEENIKGKSILIVDDVMTTGSTLEACIHKLLKSGADNVSVATIAVAV